MKNTPQGAASSGILWGVLFVLHATMVQDQTSEISGR